MATDRGDEILVVGAGIGGLAAALALAGRGLAVRVVEAGPRPGGKAGTVEVDGVVIDTGPSVLTLPEVFAGLFERAGLRSDCAGWIRDSAIATPTAAWSRWRTTLRTPWPGSGRLSVRAPRPNSRLS